MTLLSALVNAVLKQNLQLPVPEKNISTYFRKFSAIILVDAGDFLPFKRLGSWKSSTVAEEYVNESLKNINIFDY